MSIRPSFMLFAFAAAVTAPALSYADTLGSAGPVTAVTVHNKASDAYPNHYGSVVIREGTEPGSPTREYRWGGAVCANRVLSEADVALLATAFRGRADTHVVPRYKLGQAGVRCLISFTLQEPVFVTPR